MGVEITRKKDGTLRSKWWYGRFEINGKSTCVNLDVAIKGKVPKSLRELGDGLFERSRAQAQVKLDGLISEAHSQKTAEKHLQDLYELKSGTSIEQVALDDMEQSWLNLPARRKRTKLWEENQCRTLKAFRDYLTKHHSHIEYLAQVTPQMAKGWLRSLDEHGYAAATYNDKFHLLKGFFERMGQDAGIVRNPFSGCTTKIKTTVHHQPFTIAELNKILKHADPIMRPIFIVGMSTAMRQGDCCLLKWSDVDLLESFITVKTSKTGETAEIPLFPVLREEIEKQPRDSEYVFPEVAALYQKKNFGFSWRVKQVLKAAKIETTIECDDRLQQATIKGFHSLRTTWITMALSAGVPMELVRRVTGHSTVDVVLKYYFRPGREEFRTALEAALPLMITGGSLKEITPADRLKKLVDMADEMEKDKLVEAIAKIADEMAA